MFIRHVQQIVKYPAVCCRNLSTTRYSLIDSKWRERRGLPVNPNSFGSLSNLPDYTFMDGRATPIGSNQRYRLSKQREIAQKIVTMCKEIDFAKDRYIKRQQDDETEMQRILDNKLKPKGHLMIKK